MAALRGEKRRERLGDAGRELLRSPALIKAAEWLIRLLLGAALAGGKVLGEASPFGVAMVGACGPGTGGLAALLGAAGGYLLCRGLEDGLRYGAACVLTFSVAFAFYDVKVYRKGWFMPLAAGLMNGAAGLVPLLGHTWTAGVWAAYLGEMVLTAAGAYFFRMAFASWNGEGAANALRRRVSVLLLGAAVLVSLAELKLMGLFSVGRLCAVFSVLTAAWGGGIGAGSAAGVVIGLAMDLSGGGAPFYTMAYGFCGLVCGLTRRRKKKLCAMAGTAASGLILLWCWERGGPLWALYEGTAASLLFLITPQGLLEKLGDLFSGESREKEEGGPDGMERLRATAGAFSDLFAALKAAFGKGDPAGGEEDPCVIFDRAADRVCVKCPLRERCWQSGYTDTYQCLGDAMPLLLRERRGESGMFPQRFRDRCVKFPAFLSAVNEELTGYYARARYRAGMGESRRAACRRYGEMAQVLEETAEAMAQTRTVRTPRRPAPLTVTAGVAGRNRKGQAVSGDAGGWFKEGETVYLILCDGMGSGPEARRESGMTLRLLEKFLRAGVRPDLALRTLNEALALRGEVTGSFSTIDLLTLDLYEGQGTLYKLGAAPSYLRRGGCVTRLGGGGLPAGLAGEEDREPDKLTFRMDPGDSLVLLTDGVLGEGDGWVKKALGEFETDSPKALAEALVSHCPEADDDRTAVVMRVGLRMEDQD